MTDSDAAGPRAPRILVVTGAMGGGHLAVARELARRLGERGAAVEVLDLHELMPRPLARWLEWFYPWMVGRAPWLYDLIFRLVFQAPQRAGERAGPPVTLAMRGLRRRVRTAAPDVVVTNYHLAALAVGRLREEGTLAAPAITFLTTFGVHELWLHPAVDVVACITGEAARAVQARTGRPAEVTSPAVRPAVGAERPARERTRMRERWGVPADAHVALVVAGALGMGSVLGSVRALRGVPGWFPVVVCGRNEGLRARVGAEHDTVPVLGFVEDLPALMGSADVLVDNAAGLTAKEALAAGLPVVTVAPIAGHGRDDAAAMARVGLTELVDDPDAPGALAAALARVAPGTSGRTERVARGRASARHDVAELVLRVARDAHGPGARDLRPAERTEEEPTREQA